VIAGRLVRAAGRYWAFVPAPLPPTLDCDEETVLLLPRADAGLSEPSGLGRHLPNPHLLITPYVRREAVPSSRIEGTKTNLAELLLGRDRLPDLVQCALVHEQFEAIHPFLDGNGRVGRLLIALFLVEHGRLSQPLLYLSAFFEAHRQEYYDRLQTVRAVVDWTSWIRFFLTGVREVSSKRFCVPAS